jgi:hypothetical protein
MDVTLEGPPVGGARVTARCNFGGKLYRLPQSLIEYIHKKNDPHRGVPERKKLDVPSLGQCVPWMMRPFGGYVLDRCVPTLDCIEVLVVRNQFGIA